MDKTKEITLEYASVTGVTKENIDAVIANLNKLYIDPIKQSLKHVADVADIVDIDTEHYKQLLQTHDEITLPFLKMRGKQNE